MGYDVETVHRETMDGGEGTVKIPTDAVIPMEKLTHYLLVFREWDDKSKFLAQAGFTQENPISFWPPSEGLRSEPKPWKMEIMSTESSSVPTAS